MNKDAYLTPKYYYSQSHKEIFIYKNVFDELITFLKSNLEVEKGGFLLGSNKMNKVIVSKFHPARYTESTKSSLKFTNKTLLDFDEASTTTYSKLKILGWVHSHPDLGIFVSKQDMAVNAFFKYIAIIFDPVRNEIGVYDLTAPCPYKKVPFTILNGGKIKFKNYEISI